MPYERHGDVNGVVFPCGWILDQPQNEIRIYYGGADSCLALATVQLPDLLDYFANVQHRAACKRTGMTLFE